MTGFGRLPLPHYIEQANQACPIVPMIESAAGLRALPDILQLPGIGMVLEGALDLALDLQLGPDPCIRRSGRPCRRWPVPASKPASRSAPTRVPRSSIAIGKPWVSAATWPAKTAACCMAP